MDLARTIWCTAWTLLFALVASCTVFALEAGGTIDEFVHTGWGVKDGAPKEILAIAQTPDGYLWLGAESGLFRFDGVVFERYEPQAGPTFARRIRSLLALPNGDLWIGFYSGSVSLLRNGQAKNYTVRDGFPDGKVWCLIEDREHTIWAGTSSGLARLEGNQWKQVGREWNFSGKSVTALFVDRKGTLWVATEDALVFLLADARTFQHTSIPVGLVLQITEAASGKLWMAETTRSVRPIPLGIKLSHSEETEVRVGSQGIVFEDGDDLWIATLGDGIRRAPASEQLKGKPGRFSSRIERFTVKNGLTDDVVLTIFRDREQNIWVGTLSGLDRFRKTSLKQVTLPFLFDDPILVPGDGGELWAVIRNLVFRIGKSRVDEIRTGNTIDAAYRDSSGILWWITGSGLFRFENGNFAQYPMPKGVKKDFMNDIRATQDHSGTLWIAVERAGLFYRANGIWGRFDTPAEIAKLTPRTAFADDLGRIWFGYSEGTIVNLDGGKIQIRSTSQDSPVGDVWAIQGRNGHIWVGGESGLSLFDGRQFHSVVPTDEGRFAGISGIAELADGSLWLAESRGAIHVNAEEVRKFLETYSYRVRYEIFDSLDGFGTFLFAGQKVVEGTDGRLWFGAKGRVASLNPVTLPKSASLPVSIRLVTANGKQFAPLMNLMLPPRSVNLHVEYTALNLSAPQWVRYRFKLDGVDQEWQDAGVRREAFYTNLGPGKYRFHITARNEGGEWNTDEAVLDFRIAPAWFQTIWFRALCICTFLSLLWMLYQLRLRQFQRQFNRTLEARVSERTRIARELHDTLLQTFSASLLRFQSVSRMLPTRADEAKQRVDTAIEQASHAIAEGRDAVHQLRSGGSATADLAQSISNFVNELMNSSSSENPPEFRVQVEGTPRDLNPIVPDEAYRITAEALRNAVRYAGARKIEVEIRYDQQQLRLRIRDDGKGVDPGVLEHGHAPGHWGLPGMRERAKLLGGDLEVWSEVGSGTEVELTLPAASAYAKPVSRWSVFSRSWRSKRP